ncbi:MAG: hypothetical protein ACFCU6_01605, partial [Balneolaceae bacterium]
GIGLLYLAKEGIISNASFKEALEEFRRIYPGINMAGGMRRFLEGNWDMHILFDKGYMTVSDNHHLEVSRRIRDEYENGNEYYAYHGIEPSNLPENMLDRPSPGFLTWHQEQIYKG